MTDTVDQLHKWSKRNIDGDRALVNNKKLGSSSCSSANETITAIPRTVDETRGGDGGRGTKRRSALDKNSADSSISSTSDDEKGHGDSDNYVFGYCNNSNGGCSRTSTRGRKRNSMDKNSKICRSITGRLNNDSSKSNSNSNGVNIFGAGHTDGNDTNGDMADIESRSKPAALIQGTDFMTIHTEHGEELRREPAKIRIGKRQKRDPRPPKWHLDPTRADQTSRFMGTVENNFTGSGTVTDAAVANTTSTTSTASDTCLIARTPGIHDSLATDPGKNDAGVWGYVPGECGRLSFWDAVTSNPRYADDRIASAGIDSGGTLDRGASNLFYAAHEASATHGASVNHTANARAATTNDGSPSSDGEGGRGRRGHSAAMASMSEKTNLVIQHQQKLLLLLYTAYVCRPGDHDGVGGAGGRVCPAGWNCAHVKRMWKHAVDCRDMSCEVRRRTVLHPLGHVPIARTVR